MNKRLLFIALSVFISGITKSQTLGAFEPVTKVKKATQPKPKSTNQIYIANFSVNYQIYNHQSAVKKGESTGFGVIGGTKTDLTIGLGGITAEGLQSMTNELYNEFVNDLKANGFTLVSDQTAGQAKFYEKYHYCPTKNRE